MGEGEEEEEEEKMDVCDNDCLNNARLEKVLSFNE